MSALPTLARIRSLAAGDLAANAGDIAVLKADLVGLDARPDLREQLAPVRGWLPRLSIAALRSCPEGRFGRAYGDFLHQHGLAPFHVTDRIAPEVIARNAYGIRYATTHDMFHVLLGYGPDWVGELGVLAFTVGQGYNRTLWVQAAFAWLIYPFRSGFVLGALAAAWRRGLRLGRKAPFLLGVRLEDRLDDDLGALRAELGLE
jgi:ubiquinone biosynthesis protein Coq4